MKLFQMKLIMKPVSCHMFAGLIFQQFPFRFFIQGRSRFVRQEDASGAYSFF